MLNGESTELNGGSVSLHRRAALAGKATGAAGAPLGAPTPAGGKVLTVASQGHAPGVDIGSIWVADLVLLG
jgi:hypothetical protein